MKKELIKVCKYCYSENVVIGGKGMTHYYECKNCNRATDLIIKPEDRKHFKFYKEFVQVLFQRGSQTGIKDWSYKQETIGYSAMVIFTDGRTIYFHSDHLKWLPDLSRIVNKINARKISVSPLPYSENKQ